MATNSRTGDLVFQVAVSGDGVSIERKVNAEIAAQIIQLAVGGKLTSDASAPKKPRQRKRPRKGGSTGAEDSPKARKKRAGLPGIVKDLSMRPKGKVAFKDFIEAKKPKTHGEKQVVIVYWLREEAGLSTGIDIDHVNTCYRDAGWQRPSDLDNGLRTTASRKGWIDTSDMSDIQLTSRGEDQVEHELPPPTKN